MIKSTPHGTLSLMVLDIGVFFPGAHHPAAEAMLIPAVAAASELRTPKLGIPWHYLHCSSPALSPHFSTFFLLCSILFFSFPGLWPSLLSLLLFSLLSPTSFPRVILLLLLEPCEAGCYLLPPHALARLHLPLPPLGLPVSASLSSSCSPVSVLPKYVRSPYPDPVSFLWLLKFA